MTKIIRILSVAVLMATLLSALASCGGDSDALSSDTDSIVYKVSKNLSIYNLDLYGEIEIVSFSGDEDGKVRAYYNTLGECVLDLDGRSEKEYSFNLKDERGSEYAFSYYYKEDSGVILELSDRITEIPSPDISVPVAPDYTWDITDNILTISGQGGMPDYSEYMDRPWHEKRISSIQIADGITAISECAFFDCFGIKSISIPDSVLIIGARAFWRCDGLEEIVLSESLIYIGESAFIWCNNLASVTIPSSVSYIEDSAFAYCKSLSDIYYNGTKAQWESIKKASRWDSETAEYTVHCTDGNI